MIMSDAQKPEEKHHHKTGFTQAWFCFSGIILYYFDNYWRGLSQRHNVHKVRLKNQPNISVGEDTNRWSVFLQRSLQKP